jgi:type I restriction enzyme M protein
MKVTLEELLSDPFVRHCMADYVNQLSGAQAEVERMKAEKQAWEAGDGVEGAEDWLDAAEEGGNLPKDLEKRRKALRAEMSEGREAPTGACQGHRYRQAGEGLHRLDACAGN